MTAIRRLRAFPNVLLRSVETPHKPRFLGNVFADVSLLEVSTDPESAEPVLADTVVIDGTPYWTSDTRPVQVHYEKDGLTEVTVTFVVKSLEIRASLPSS